MATSHEQTSADGLAHPYGVEIHGPVVGNWHYALVKGRRVPHLTIQPIANDPDGEWMVCLDERWVIVGTDLEVRKWISFMADAMAVAAGYVCFGSDKRINLFNGPTFVRLSHDEAKEIESEL